MALGIASAVIERDIDGKERSALIDEFIRTMGN
jgi:F0F1-type ATP synthase membrane subunit b/b'